MPSLSLDESEKEPTLSLDDDELEHGIFQPVMPVPIQKRKREMNVMEAREWKKKGLEDLGVANFAFSGVSNLWMTVKRAPTLTLAHVLALRILATEHRKNILKLLELDPLDTLLSWLARPLAGIDRQIVVHTLGTLVQVAAHVEDQRVALQVNILSQLNFILDYCRNSSRSASAGSHEVLQHCIMVTAAVAEDPPGQHALCVMGYVPKLLDLLDMGYGPQVDMEIFYVLEAVSQGASGLKEVLNNDCIPRVLRRMQHPLTGRDQDLYTYNDVVLGLGCRLLSNVASSTEGAKVLFGQQALKVMKDVILQAPDDPTVVSDAILVVQRLSESRRDEFAQQMHSTKMLSTCLDAMEYHDHVISIQQSVMTILSHMLTNYRKNIVAYGGHVLVTNVLANFPFTKDLRRAAIELLNSFITDKDLGEVCSRLEHFLTSVEVWLDDPSKPPVEMVQQFTGWHMRLKESILKTTSAPKADALLSSLTSRWSSRKAPSKPWVRPRKVRHDEPIVELPIEEGSMSPNFGSRIMNLDSSALSPSVYNEWQGEYMRNSQRIAKEEPPATFTKYEATAANAVETAPVQVEALVPKDIILPIPFIVTEPPPEPEPKPMPKPIVKVSFQPPPPRKSESVMVPQIIVEAPPMPSQPKNHMPFSKEDGQHAEHHHVPSATMPSQTKTDMEPPAYQNWSVDMVCGWLHSEGLGKYDRNFRAHRVAGDLLDELNDEILQEQLQITVWGDRRRLLAALGELKRTTTAALAMRIANNLAGTLGPSSTTPKSQMPKKETKKVITACSDSNPTSVFGTSTALLLNDLPAVPKTTLTKTQPDAPNPHTLEARANYLSRMHSRAERGKQKNQQLVDPLAVTKAMQEKVDEMVEQQRKVAFEEAQRQQQLRAVELTKERELVARAAYMKRMLQGKPMDDDSKVEVALNFAAIEASNSVTMDQTQSAAAANGASLEQPRLQSETEDAASSKIVVVTEAQILKAVMDIQRMWRGHRARQWVQKQLKKLAAERQQLEMLWHSENEEAQARCMTEEWEAEAHSTILTAMDVSQKAIQYLTAELHQVRANLEQQKAAAVPVGVSQKTLAMALETVEATPLSVGQWLETLPEEHGSLGSPCDQSGTESPSSPIQQLYRLGARAGIQLPWLHAFSHEVRNLQAAQSSAAPVQLVSSTHVPFSASPKLIMQSPCSMPSVLSADQSELQTNSPSQWVYQLHHITPLPALSLLLAADSTSGQPNLSRALRSLMEECTGPSSPSNVMPPKQTILQQKLDQTQLCELPVKKESNKGGKSGKGGKRGAKAASPAKQAAAEQPLAKADVPQPTSQAAAGKSQPKPPVRASVFQRKPRSPWEEWMEEQRALAVAMQEDEQIGRLHIEEGQWAVFKWLQHTEKIHREARIELLLAEIGIRGNFKMEEAVEWQVIMAKVDALQSKVQLLLCRMLEEEERRMKEKEDREAEEIRLRQEAEDQLRRNGRKKRNLLLKDWYREAATSLQREQAESYSRLVADEGQARHTLAASCYATLQKAQEVAAARRLAEARAKEELERQFKAAHEAAMARLQRELQPPPPVSPVVAVPTKEAVQSSPLSWKSAIPASYEEERAAVLPSPKVLPPIQKRGEWESITDAEGWKHLFQDMSSSKLAALACGRLVDGYLKTGRRPPQFLMRADQLLQAPVLDISDVGLADTHVAPLLILLKRSQALQCLHLDNNALTDQSAFLVADLLLACKTLYRLTMSWNNVSSAGALRIIEALSVSPQVSCLELDGNNVSHLYLLKLQAITQHNSTAIPAVSQPPKLSYSYPALATQRQKGPESKRPVSPGMQWDHAMLSASLSPVRVKCQRQTRASRPVAAPLPSLSGADALVKSGLGANIF